MSMIEKVTNPTRFDMAPRGTVWKHGEDLWVQISKEEGHGTAEWLPVGSLVIKVIRGCVLREDFILACINILDGDKINLTANLNVIVKGIKNEIESSDF